MRSRTRRPPRSLYDSPKSGLRSNDAGISYRVVASPPVPVNRAFAARATRSGAPPPPADGVQTLAQQRLSLVRLVEPLADRGIGHQLLWRQVPRPLMRIVVIAVAARGRAQMRRGRGRALLADVLAGEADRALGRV